MAALLLTTELDAVNAMLATIGEAPIASLPSSSPDATEAQAALHRTSRQVQARSTPWNTSYGVKLTADTNSPYEITLDPDVLNIEPAGQNRSDPYFMRAGKLFDAGNDTFSFQPGQVVEANLTRFLAYEDLPEPARNYILVAATRSFQDSVLTSDSIHAYTNEDLAQARAALKSFESRVRRVNALRYNPNSRFATSRFMEV